MKRHEAQAQFNESIAKALQVEGQFTPGQLLGEIVKRLYSNQKAGEATLSDPESQERQKLPDFVTAALAVASVELGYPVTPLDLIIDLDIQERVLKAMDELENDDPRLREFVTQARDIVARNRGSIAMRTAEGIRFDLSDSAKKLTGLLWTIAATDKITTTHKTEAVINLAPYMEIARDSLQGESHDDRWDVLLRTLLSSPAHANLKEDIIFSSVYQSIGQFEQKLKPNEAVASTDLNKLRSIADKVRGSRERRDQYLAIPGLLEAVAYVDTVVVKYLEQNLDIVEKSATVGGYSEVVALPMIVFARAGEALRQFNWVKFIQDDQFGDGAKQREVFERYERLLEQQEPSVMNALIGEADPLEMSKRYVALVCNVPALSFNQERRPAMALALDGMRDTVAALVDLLLSQLRDHQSSGEWGAGNKILKGLTELLWMKLSEGASVLPEEKMQAETSTCMQAWLATKPPLASLAFFRGDCRHLTYLINANLQFEQYCTQLIAERIARIDADHPIPSRKKAEALQALKTECKWGKPQSISYLAGATQIDKALARPGVRLGDHNPLGVTTEYNN